MMKNLNFGRWGLLPLLSVVLLLSSACAAPYEFQMPPDTTGGWEVGTLDEVGLDEKPIAQALQRIDATRGNTMRRIFKALLPNLSATRCIRSCP
jgi:hypothetical protein